MGYNRNIDILKGIAIFFVIVIHSFTNDDLLLAGAPFYIQQAVPVFLILTGYNHTMSYERKGGQTLAQLYRPMLFVKKLKRVLCPALTAYVFQIIIAPLIGREPNVFFYLIGRGGYGGYFISIMIQVLFILPLLYFFSKKNPHLMLFLSLAFNLLFELAADTLGLPGFIYRLLFFRYLSAIALGIWYFYVRENTCAIRLIKYGALISIPYLIMVHYFDYEVPFYNFNTAWKGQDPLTFFYPLLLTHVGLNDLSKIKWHWLSEGLMILGKGSYHIFIVQMVYFWIFSDLETSFLPFFPVNLLVCIALGLSFYRVETRFMKEPQAKPQEAESRKSGIKKLL